MHFTNLKHLKFYLEKENTFPVRFILFLEDVIALFQKVNTYVQSENTDDLIYLKEEINKMEKKWEIRIL